MRSEVLFSIILVVLYAFVAYWYSSQASMSAEVLFSIILVVIYAVVAYWYSRQARPGKPSPPPTMPQPVVPPPSQALRSSVSSVMRPRWTNRRQQPVVASPSKALREMDPFLREVVSEKAHTDAAVIAASQEHERELQEQFGDDVKLKERLSWFARENKLDKALIALWEEIRCYPAWARRDDFDKWNKLHLTDISGSHETAAASVEFMHGAQRFKVTQKEETYSCDFSFFEGADEVFAINCSVKHGEYATTYSCSEISAFKKRGIWAKVLLEYYGRIQIEEDRSSAKYKYRRADEIKSRFEE